MVRRNCASQIIPAVRYNYISKLINLLLNYTTMIIIIQYLNTCKKLNLDIRGSLLKLQEQTKCKVQVS